MNPKLFVPPSRPDVCNACHSGDLQKLKQWVADGLLQRLEPGQPFLNDLFLTEYAVFGRQLETLQWLLEESGFGLNLRHTGAHELHVSAAIQGSLEIVRWLFEKIAQRENDIGLTAARRHEAAIQTFWAAATSGSIPIMAWIFEKLDGKIQLSADNNAYLREIVNQQQFEALKWIFANLEIPPSFFDSHLDWNTRLPEPMQREVDELRDAAAQLSEMFNFQKYLHSAVCRQALKAKLVTTPAQLEELYQRTAHLHSAKRPREL